MSDNTDDGFVRTVLGDRATIREGWVYGHEHLIIDSPLIAQQFPHIHLHDVDSATSEVESCRAAGVALLVDTMPASAGRDAVRLAEISRRTGVDVVAATGLHHDRYYGNQHWTNRIEPEQLVELFVQDLTVGIDEFDYTGPIVRRTGYRAGIVKAATSGVRPDERDARNLWAAGTASLLTGAPLLTHCEGGYGGLAQLEILIELGVPASSILLSHVDKAHDLAYLHDLAETGAILELDQGLREYERGLESVTVQAILSLLEGGFGPQIIVGTDGARRNLWTSLGGSPGLAWLAKNLPGLLGRAGIDEATVEDIMRNNAVQALRWRRPIVAGDEAGKQESTK